MELVVSDKGLDPAERDAALSICLISGAENGGVNPLTLRAIYHDHCYTQLPTPPPTPNLESRWVSWFVQCNGVMVTVTMVIALGQEF